MEEMEKTLLSGLASQENSAQAAEAALEESRLPGEDFPGLGSLRESFRGLKAQLEDYALLEQDALLASEPEIGDIYRDYRQEVLDLVDYCRKNGREEVDAQAAFQAILGRNLAAVCQKIRQRARQEAVAAIGANRRASPGALSTGSPAAPRDFRHMPQADFAALSQRAKRGELRQI